MTFMTNILVRKFPGTSKPKSESSCLEFEGTVEIRVTVFPVVFVRIFRARERAGNTRTLAIDTYLIFVCVVALRVDLL